MSPRPFSLLRAASASLCFALVGARLPAAERPNVRVQELTEQNRQLQEQVRDQQKTIDEINARLADILRTSERHERVLRGLEDRVDASAGNGESAAIKARDSNRDSTARISAETGLAYFKTGRNGQFPVGGFRADDPVISVEAPVIKNVYFFTELKLLPREANDEHFQLGELYVDFEDVLSSWRPGLLNVRAGRVNVPFGEEYLARGPIANQLISHSLSDIWGCDEGVEIYGRIGPVQYVVAVQNGGVSRLRDFNSDKAVVARVSWNPARWLHVSGSAMRTGRLATVADNLSELWFGNAFFRALGPAATTATFSANLFEADATAHWRGGHVTASLGQVRYDDSDTRTDNARRLRYGSLEAVQEIAAPLYVAARFSSIRVNQGYPIAGWGTMGGFFFRPGVLTEELRRLSVGLGYRFGPPLVLKVEYGWESGRLTSGVSRDHEDFFGTQLGVKF